MKRNYLPPEVEVDLFTLSSSEVITTSGNLEIPDIDIDILDPEF